MNRPRRCLPSWRTNVPHARGDEPAGARYWLTFCKMFPTHVGMNRSISDDDALPRVCSPRTWGLSETVTTQTRLTAGFFMPKFGGAHGVTSRIARNRL